MTVFGLLHGGGFGDRSERIVLVGHALGCALLPLVATATAASQMVWVCGIIPVAGLSCADQIAADPKMIPMFTGRGHDEIGPRTPDVLSESLFPDCDASTKSWAIAMMGADDRDHSTATTTNVVTERYPDFTWPDIPCAYILGQADRALSPDWCRRAATERLGVDAIELPGGHSPLLCRPAELARVLLELAIR